ncbi:MAG: hypothetical protein H7210_09755, partial [Pyrinomonadaceae bacterium]|nr:hypothetical protein [Phycisphaerales bacterium]
MSNHSRSTALVGAFALVLSWAQWNVCAEVPQRRAALWAGAREQPATTPSDQPTKPPTPAPTPPQTPPHTPAPTPAPQAPVPGLPAEPTPPPPAVPVAPLPMPPKPLEPPGKKALPPGTEVILILKEGNRVTGILVEELPDAIRVRIAGIETTFKSDMIERYEVMRPILERYEEMKRAIGEDPDGLATLAEWLRSREQHELALKEVNHLLKIDPNHTEGKRLKLLIEKQIELRSKARSSDPKAPAVRPAPANAAPKTPVQSFPLLTDSQINLLKVFEIDLDDPPRMTIKRSTVTRLIDENLGTPHIPVTQEGRDAIYRKTPAAILDLMFKLRARDLYAE